MKNARIRAYDSLRFIGIIFVILYHYFPRVFSGGYLGVDIFLVLSGFMLAYRAEDRLRKGEELRLWETIQRRFLGLAGPLLLFMAISLAVLAIFRRDFLTNIHGNVISSLLFLNNWQQIIAGQSYFDSFINPSIYTHLWYLSLYFQLVLIWTLAYPLLRRACGENISRARKVLLALALASGGLMFALSLSLDDPTRVYYGTDTRAYAFLLGAVAGLKVHDTNPADYNKDRVDKLIGLLILVIFVFLFALADRSFFTYKFGMPIFAGIVALVVYLLSFKRTRARYILSFKPTALVGENSMALYLCYYPVYILLFQAAQTAKLTWLDGVLQIGLIFILAYAFDRVYHIIQGQDEAKKRVLALGLLAFIGLVLIFSPRDQAVARLREEKEAQEKIMEAQNKKKTQGQTDQVKEPGKEDKDRAGQSESTEADQDQPSNQAGQEESERKKETETEGEEETETESSKEEGPTSKADYQAYLADLSEEDRQYFQFLTEEEGIYAHDKEVSFFGDSLTLMASSGLSLVFPKSNIYSEVSLHLEDAFPMASQALENDECADTVVAFIGSNGGFSSQRLEEFIDLFEGRQVYLVTTHVNRNWRTEVNETIKEVASKKENAYLIDWSSYYDLEADPATWIREEDDVHFSYLGVCHYIDYMVGVMVEEEKSLTN